MCRPTDLLGLFCQSIGITKTHDHHKLTKIENTINFFYFLKRTWLNYDQPQSPPAHSLSRSMILVAQASRVSLCLALTRLGLREDMSLIKETHSMHKIRIIRLSRTTINCVKSLPRTVPQFRCTYLSNCSPANDERLAVKLDRELSSSFAPFEKERSRFSKSAQSLWLQRSRGLRESRQRLLHSAHDEEWVALKKIDSELS